MQGKLFDVFCLFFERIKPFNIFCLIYIKRPICRFCQHMGLSLHRFISLSCQSVPWSFRLQMRKDCTYENLCAQSVS